MTVLIGDTVPDVMVKTLGSSGVTDISIATLCAGRNAVLFAVPGAFTPDCSARHLPGFVEHAGDFKAKGIDLLGCIAVNDIFVMTAWAARKGSDGKVMMLADGNGDFTRAMGLVWDATMFGMGLRSQRYAMVLRDARIEKLFVEEQGAFDVSAAPSILAQL